MRVDETGREKTFSVDLYSTKALSCGITFDVLYECKYKRPNTAWIFIPTHKSDVYSPRSIYSHYDLFNEKTYIEHVDLESLSLDLPIVTKGVEITNNRDDLSPIREAISQIKYGILERYIKSAIRHLEIITTMQNNSEKLRLITGVIVTTTELWVLRDDVTLDQIKSAETLSDVAKSVKSLYLRDLPSEELIRYAKKRLIDELKNYNSGADGYDAEFRKRVQELMQDENKLFEFSYTIISQIGICNIDHVTDYIERHRLLVESTSIVTTN